ncbi:MAG: helix-turn-helix transcriptional regulator [Proteobacteria bacterium]|nr:helix-turn-helix transcriptional regulator [Pseudomonadota bacterium]
MAELTGVKRGVINAYEHGKNLPNLGWLSKFVVICNTDYSYIIDGKDSNDKVVHEPVEPYHPDGLMDMIQDLGDKLDASTLEKLKRSVDSILTELKEKQDLSIHLINQQKEIINLLQTKLQIKIKDK